MMPDMCVGLICLALNVQSFVPMTTANPAVQPENQSSVR